MTRYSFGGDITHLLTTADSALGGALKVAPGATIQFYVERSGGSPQTNYMVDANGTGTYDTEVTAITSRDTGYLPNFQGPEDVTILYYDPNPNDDDVQRVRLEAWDVDIANLGTATETVQGLVRRATQSEVDAGVVDSPYVSPFKLAASTLFLRARNAVVALGGGTDSAAEYTVTDDGSSQTTWPRRLSFFFGSVLTGHFDSFGQLRANAAKATSVAFAARNANPGATGNLIEAAASASAAASFFVDATGKVHAPNVGQKVLVLDATAPVPAGTPDRTLIARIASTTSGGDGGGGTTTLLKDHPHEGTAGTKPTASQEGYTSAGGSIPTYVTGGIVGSTALQWQAAVTGNMADTFPAQDADLYVRFYYKQNSDGSGSTNAIWSTSIGCEVRIRTNEIVIVDNTANTNSVAITKPPVGTWWRGLWRIGQTTSTLSIWTVPAATGLPDYTQDFTWASPKLRPTNLLVGQKTTTGGVLSIDAVAIGTAPIGPAA